MSKEKKRSSVLPPPACLEKAARHVKHDTCMLEAALKESHGRLAYIAWYTLCRSVFEFLEGTQPPTNKNDIMAVQFFEDPKVWEEAKKGAGDPPDDYLEVRDWTNVLAAHLSYNRIGYEGNYDVAPSPEVTKHLWKLYECFLDALSETRRQWFEEAPDPRVTRNHLA